MQILKHLHLNDGQQSKGVNIITILAWRNKLGLRRKGIINPIMVYDINNTLEDIWWRYL
jgi:hypothetical protein